MKRMKSELMAPVLTILIFVVVISAVLSQIVPPKPQADRETNIYKSTKFLLEEQQNFTLQKIATAGDTLQQETTLVLVSDENGIYGFTGVITAALNSRLEDLAMAYNNDPSTTAKIEPDSLKYCLTGGIVEATLTDVRDTPFHQFLAWCNKPSDLVDKESGAKLDQEQISNFDAIWYSEKTKGMVFAWDY